MSGSKLKRTIAGFLVLGALCGSCRHLAYAAGGPQFTIDYTSIISPTILKGVDTIVVADLYGPGTTKLIDVNRIDTKSFLTNAVRKIFSEANERLPASDSWIAIKSYPNEIADPQQANILSLNFVLSARQEHVGGRLVTVGALELNFLRTLPGQPSTVDTQPASYPFIVPSDPALLEARIEDGVRLLASYLPSYMVCANKHGHRSNECPDCVESCRIDNAYGGQ